MVLFRTTAVLAFLSLPGFAQLTGFAAAEKISRENRPRVDSLAANGIDTGTGAFITSQTLMLIRGVRPLSVTLSYNSLLTGNPGVLGPGWSHEYEAYLDGSLGGVVTVHWDINRKNSFRCTSAGQPCDPLDEAVAHDQLLKDGNHWVLTLRDGTIYSFDEDGNLEFIENRVGQKIEAIRNNGQLRQVQEPSGKRIEFHYNEADTVLRHLEDNADRLVYFDYDAGGMLAAIRGPATQGLSQGSSFSSRPIPDNGTLTATINVSSPDQMGLLRFNDFTISHPRLSDVVVRLRSPQGTTVQLTTGKASGLWSLTSTVLGDFDGEDPRGTWTLTVQDTRSGQTGQLNSWRMRFTEPTNPVIFSNGSGGQILESFDRSSRRIFANNYDFQGRIILQDDGRTDNMVSRVAYTETGGGVKTTYQDRTGAETILEHDANYRLTAVTDPLGARTTYGYNSRGDRTTTTDPLGRTAQLSFSPEGDLISYVDASGAVWTFDHADGDVTSIRDPLGKRTELTYQNHRVTGVKNAECLADPACAGDSKGYAADGRILSNLRSDGAGLNFTWQQGRPVGVARPTGDGTETAEYDEVGRVTVSKNVAGDETRFTYNSASQVLTQTDALGYVQSREYDLRGQVIRSTNTRGDTTTFAYDGNGNLVSRTNPLGETTRYTYDGEDRLVRTENAEGHGSTSEFDAAGRLVKQSDDAGVSLRFEYDAVGNRVATYDSNDLLIERVTYDDRDLPLVTTDAYGNTTSTQYDELARPISLKDAQGDAETYDYDRNDRPDTVRDRLSRTFSQEYSKVDTVTGITNARGETLKFEYDKGNHVTKIESPGGRVAEFGYNNRDLLSFEQFDDVVLEYTYDDIGRLIREERHDGEVIAYDLDAAGNATAIRSQAMGESSPSIKLRFDYDALNRVTRFQDRDGNVLRYTYNAAGSVETLTYPDGKQVHYVYDAGERLTEIVDWADRHTRYTYDSNGNPVRVELPNGVVQELAYDKGGRLIHRTDHSGGDTIVDLRYSFDDLNRLSDVQVTPPPAPYIPQPVNMTFAADDRVTAFNGSNVQYDGRGQLTFGPLGDSFGTFAYDKAGNLVRAGSHSYVYDELDHLIRIDGPEGSTRLVVNPVPELPQVLVSTGPAGTTRYVWGPGLVYEETNGSIRTHHYDYAGNTVALADESGAVTGTVSYGPYGEIAARSGASTLFQYGGVFGILTDASGLVNMRARWYSPQLRRFLTEDAAIGRPGEARSLNRYAYGGLNPVSFNDPSGRFLNVVFGAIAGAVVNVVAKTVVTLVVEHRWPTAGEVAGAAVEGAITGALLGACGPGCGYLASAAIGAVGAYNGSLTQQLIDTGTVDPVQLGVDTGLGAAFGGLGAVGKVGKGARGTTNEFAERGAGAAKPARFARPKSISPNGAASKSSNLLKPPERSAVLLRPKSSVPKPSLSARLHVQFILHRKEIAKDLLKDFGASTVETAIGDAISNALVPAIHGLTDGNQQAARADGRTSVNSSSRQEFGQFRHWNAYTSALALAGLPQPDPAPNLGTY